MIAARIDNEKCLSILLARDAEVDKADAVSIFAACIESLDTVRHMWRLWRLWHWHFCSWHFLIDLPVEWY